MTEAKSGQHTDDAAQVQGVVEAIQVLAVGADGLTVGWHGGLIFHAHGAPPNGASVTVQWACRYRLELHGCVYDYPLSGAPLSH